MNKQNASKLWKMTQETGDYLLGSWNALSNASNADNLPFIKN